MQFPTWQSVFQSPQEDSPGLSNGSFVLTSPASGCCDEPQGGGPCSPMRRVCDGHCGQAFSGGGASATSCTKQCEAGTQILGIFRQQILALSPSGSVNANGRLRTYPYVFIP